MERRSMLAVPIVHHRVLEQPQLDPGVEEVVVVGAGDPVRDDVVRVLRDDHPHVHPAPGRDRERPEDLAVGDEVGHRDVDRVDGTVEGVEVDAADREQQSVRRVGGRLDLGEPLARAVVGQLGEAPPSVVVPEVDEGVLQLPGGRAADDLEVRVPPRGRVHVADVVPADVRGLSVDDEELAVVAARLAHVAQDQSRAEEGEAQDVQPRVVGEPVEPRVLVEVAEGVVDDVDVDAAPGRVLQGRLEPLADLVRLPDERLEEDPLRGARDGREHVLEEVRSVGEDGRARAEDVQLPRRRRGELAGQRLAPLAHVVRGDDPGDRDGLRGETEGRAEGQRAGGGPERVARHGISLCSDARGPSPRPPRGAPRIGPCPLSTLPRSRASRRSPASS
jgi:hypothetical protein